MRTTLDIDDDLLTAAKELARRQGVSSGRIVSQLLRKALTGQSLDEPAFVEENMSETSFGGFRPFPAGPSIATNDDVNRLRDAEGI